MSSVLKNLRSLSDMEFYKNAWSMRKELTEWLMKDFGAQRNPRSVDKVIRDISYEDKEVIDDIFIRYGKSKNKEFASQYPAWFFDIERAKIMQILSAIIEKITMANSIYAVNDSEMELRRCYQDEAIGLCFTLYQELQYIISVIDTDINKFIPIIDKIEREIELLKGWRKSNRKIKS